MCCRCESELFRTMGDGVSGTTALVATVAGGTLYTANLGDCRAVLCCNGRAVQVWLSDASLCGNKATINQHCTMPFLLLNLLSIF